MREFLDSTLLGVTVGMVYAAVALGLVLIWRSTRVLNFAQGAMATLTTFIAASVLDHSVGYWAAFAIAMAAGFAVGAATERVFIRPLADRHPLDAVIVSIGLFITLEALAGTVWGPNQRGFPAPFSIASGFHLGSMPIAVTPFDLFVVAAVLVLMAVMASVFRFTGTGLRMRAAAAAPEVAALLGVRVRSMLSLGWAVAAACGALAGLLVAPTAYLYPGNMDIYLILGFVAAVV
ncbi:MAG TPA: branched-chain amino acid ABC transporter permease, partial [Streptosporangiaceae bacterium]|nr:branched-chain amino acid ABC transporter permease [Streptosporangiaceae bacterium]